MNKDQHERIDQLLPWFVSRTLSDAESAEVRRHAANCVACRGQLRELEELQAVVRDAPLPSLEVSPPVVERRAAAITEAQWPRLDGEPRENARPLRWAWLSRAAALALMAGLLLFSGDHRREQADLDEAPRFRTLASQPRALSTDGPRVRVLFAESVTERHLRELLHKVGGRIVDGPSAAGLYVVALGPSQDEDLTLEDRLLTLRTDDGVRFVEIEPAAP